MNQPNVSIDEMIKEARREVKMRHSVYPRWIDKGHITPKAANEQIRRMTAILEFLEKSKQPTLI